MIDYFRKVAPARGYAIHDAILNGNGLGLMTKLMGVRTVAEIVINGE